MFLVVFRNRKRDDMDQAAYCAEYTLFACPEPRVHRFSHTKD